MLTIARVALVATSAVVLVGCGAETETPRRTATTSDERTATYEAMVLDVHTSMNGAMSSAFATATLDADLVRAAREQAQDARERMRSATVPDAYARAHEEYVQGLDVFVQILGDVEAQVHDPDVARRHLEDERFGTGVRHLEQASALYTKAGLDLDEGEAER